MNPADRPAHDIAACAVLIGTPDFLPTLRQHVENISETLAFTDAELSEAVETIGSRRPRAILLEQFFALSSRGAAFIRLVKADPSLGAPEIAIVSREGRVVRLSSRAAPSAEPPPRSRATAAMEVPAPPPVSAPAPPESPDPRSARRAPRFPVGETLEVLVDGTAAKPINLSMFGVQVVSPGTLRPKQRVRMTLTDETGKLRVSARIAWASFERADGVPGPVYRAGMEFSDADPAAMNAFCKRHARC